MKFTQIGGALWCLCLSMSAIGQQTDIIHSASGANAFDQMRIGQQYLSGDGVIQNDHEALKWLMQAAEQGEPTAQRLVGQMFAEGRGVEKDPLEARFWYESAAKNGDVMAQSQLAHYHTSESTPLPTVAHIPNETNLSTSATPVYRDSTAPREIELTLVPVTSSNKRMPKPLANEVSQETAVIQSMRPMEISGATGMLEQPQTALTHTTIEDEVYVVPISPHTTSPTETFVTSTDTTPIDMSARTNTPVSQLPFDELVEQAMSGNAIAQIKLADHYASIADYVEAYKWLVVAAQDRKAWTDIRRIGNNIRPLMSQQQIDDALNRAQRLKGRIVINRTHR